MNSMSFCLLFIVIICSHRNTLADIAENDEVADMMTDGTYYIIELTSICANNSSPLNSDNIRLHLRLRQHVGMYHQDSLSQSKFGFASYDVCNDTFLLSRALADILLNRKFRFRSTGVSSYNLGSTSECAENVASNVIAVVSVMPFHLTKLAADVLSMEHIPYFAYFEMQSTEVEVSNKNFYTVGNLLLDDLFEIKRQILTFSIQHVALVVVENEYSHMGVMSRNRLWEELIKYSELCIDMTDLDASNMTEIKQYLYRVKHTKSLKMVIIWYYVNVNKRWQMTSFQSIYSLTEGIKDKTWYWYSEKSLFSFLYHQVDPFSLETHVFLMTPITGNFLVTNFIRDSVVTSSVYRQLTNDKWIERFIKERGVVTHSDHLHIFDDDTSIAARHIEDLFTPIWFMTPYSPHIKRIWDNIATLTQMLIIKYVVIEGTSTPFLSLKNGDYSDVYKLLRKINKRNSHVCRVPQCPPGFEPKKEIFNFSKNERRFNWRCSKCFDYFRKSEFGNQSCVRCDGIMISNSNKTECYDPYMDMYLTFGGKHYFIIMSIAIPAAVFNIAAIITFIKHRNTPVVRSCGGTTCIVQLFSYLFIFVEIFSVFPARPNFIICVSQMTISGLLLTIILSITVTKTQDVLAVFRSKVSLCDKQICVSYAVKSFIHSLLIGMEFIICWISFKDHFEHTTVEIILDRIEFTRMISCRYSDQFHIQFGFILLLSLFCSVQAFRARRLPILYNEANQIAYSAYVTTVIICVRYPVAYSQQNDAQSFINALVIILISISQLFITFASPMHTMLFRPQRNTKTYFRFKMFENAKKSSIKVMNQREERMKLSQIRRDSLKTMP